MNRLTGQLVAAIVGLAVLVSAGPTLIALAEAAVPLIVAVGIVVVALKLVWFYTNRY